MPRVAFLSSIVAFISCSFALRIQTEDEEERKDVRMRRLLLKPALTRLRLLAKTKSVVRREGGYDQSPSVWLAIPPNVLRSDRAFLSLCDKHLRILRPHVPQSGPVDHFLLSRLLLIGDEHENV